MPFYSAVAKEGVESPRKALSAGEYTNRNSDTAENYYTTIRHLMPL
jgi:hypothetical protein